MGTTAVLGAAPNPAVAGLSSPAFDPAMMQAAMQMMGGGMGTGPGIGACGFPQPAGAQSAEERYANQLDQLSNMGFPDKHSNLQALQTANGDINQAINALLGA